MISGVELAQRTGISYRQVDYWTRCGILIPDVPAHGSGSSREWSTRETRIAAALGELRRLNAPLDVLAEVAEELRSLLDQEWRGLTYIDSFGVLHDQPAAPGWCLDLAAFAE